MVVIVLHTVFDKGLARAVAVTGDVIDNECKLSTVVIHAVHGMRHPEHGDIGHRLLHTGRDACSPECWYDDHYQQDKPHQDRSEINKRESAILCVLCVVHLCAPRMIRVHAFKKSAVIAADFYPLNPPNRSWISTISQAHSLD